MVHGHSEVKRATMKNSVAIRMILSATVAFAVIGQPVCSWASLGGSVGTVQADQARMRASLKTTEKDLYAIHEMRAPNNVVVREFVSRTGLVFGVAWQGPARPDLQQLLGGNFATFTEAAKAQKEYRTGRGPLLIQQSGLVVRMGGHARAFFGSAYIPQMVPAGVHAEEIQ
jgi:hypothetical protein